MHAVNNSLNGTSWLGDSRTEKKVGVCLGKSAVNAGSAASIPSGQQLLSTHFLLTHLQGQDFRNREVLQLLLSGQGASGSK